MDLENGGFMARRRENQGKGREGGAMRGSCREFLHSTVGKKVGVTGDPLLFRNG